MVNISGFSTQQNVKNTVEEDKAGYTLLESGVYDAVIKCMYLQPIGSKQSQKAVVILNIGNKDITDEEVVLNTEGRNTQKKDETKLLPGFLKMNAFSYVTCGKELQELGFEEKDIKIYNKKERKEEVVRRQVAVELIGKPVKVGLQHAILSRQQEQNGVWVSTDRTYESNIVDKYFSVDGKTHSEMIQNKSPEFIDSWKTRFNKQKVNKTDKQVVPYIEKPESGAVSTTPTKSLFAQ